MQTIVIDDPSVCLSVTLAGCTKMAERIDVLLTPWDPRNTCLGSPFITAREGGSMRPLPAYFGQSLTTYCTVQILV